MNRWLAETTRALGAALLLLLLLACAGSQAVSSAVEAFDMPAWKRLQSAVKPTVVVFTATSCADCPAVLERMARDLHRRRPDAALVAVLTDAAPGEAERALLGGRRYRGADRWMAFAGSPQALRQAVNPQWPSGVMPYVGLLGSRAGPAWMAGAPSAADLERWLAVCSARH